MCTKHKTATAFSFFSPTNTIAGQVSCIFKKQTQHRLIHLHFIYCIKQITLVHKTWQHCKVVQDFLWCACSLLSRLTHSTFTLLNENWKINNSLKKTHHCTYCYMNENDIEHFIGEKTAPHIGGFSKLPLLIMFLFFVNYFLQMRKRLAFRQNSCVWKFTPKYKQWLCQKFNLSQSLESIIYEASLL